MSSSSVTHIVRCAHCTQNFDAVAAAFCSCVATERTLVCPNCSRCFCDANAAYKRQFWTGAPKELWDRKRTEHSGQSAAAVAAAPQDVTRPLVLLVEDEPSIQRVAALVIQSLGYGLVLGKNGEEGLELARKHRPDLILTDALMPKLDGREMAKAIRAEPDLAATKIVVMTALYTGVKYRLEAHRSGFADEYLEKPLSPEKLKETLGRLLG